MKHITAFVHAGTQNSTSAQCTGHSNRELNQKKKAQKREKCGTKQTMKRVPVYRMRAEPRDAERTSDDSSGPQGSGTQSFHHSARVHARE